MWWSSSTTTKTPTASTLLEPSSNPPRSCLAPALTLAVSVWLPTGKAHCVVLEYGERSLADFLKRGQLQRNERKFIVDRLANVVQHLHAQNVVHCDLKPHNFVLFGLKWKVIDLENARRAGEPVSMRVSPSYCSPEMAREVLSKQAERMRACGL